MDANGDDDFDNPLFDYLIEHQSVPSGCVDPWPVYFLAMISIFSAVLSIIFFDRGFPAGFDNSDVVWYTFRIIWPPAFIMPIITAVIAAMLTVRTIRNSSYELVQVSGLSSQQLVQAFVFGASYWLRSWMVWQMGFAPLLIAGFLHLYTKLHVGTLGSMLMPLILATGFAATIYFSVTTAVALGLRWRNWILAAFVSLFLAMIAVLGLILVILAPTGMVISERQFSTASWLLAGLALTTIVLVSGAGIEWLAQRWVRYIKE